MSKVKFIHTADLHLDTPFKGLATWNNALAARLKNATVKSFQKVVDLCLSEHVDFLLIAGDSFDSETSSLAAQLKFVSELQRLADNHIAVYIVCGNHDPVSSWLDTLRLPPNVHRFSAKQVQIVTHKKNNKPLADIHGISFHHKAVTENLALKFNPSEHPAAFSIALLHATIGPCGPHENYAPFKLPDVLGKPYDYWALGHLHQQRIVHEAYPAIVYPGNPQGRDFGESGIKGCYLVEIEAGYQPRLSFIPTQQIRFEEITIDLTGEDKLNALLDQFDAGIKQISSYDQQTSYIVRIILKGRSALHTQLHTPAETEQLREHLNEGQLNRDHFIWIDQIQTQTFPDIDLEQVSKRSDFPAEIIKTIDNLAADPQQVQALIHAVDSALNQLRVKREITAVTDTECKELLEKAKWMLIDQLIQP
jgi:exonuclease SbcD